MKKSKIESRDPEELEKKHKGAAKLGFLESYIVRYPIEKLKCNLREMVKMSESQNIETYGEELARQKEDLRVLVLGCMEYEKDISQKPYWNDKIPKYIAKTVKEICKKSSETKQAQDSQNNINSILSLLRIIKEIAKLKVRPKNEVFTPVMTTYTLNEITKALTYTKDTEVLKVLILFLNENIVVNYSNEGLNSQAAVDNFGRAFLVDVLNKIVDSTVSLCDEDSELLHEYVVPAIQNIGGYLVLRERKLTQDTWKVAFEQKKEKKQSAIWEDSQSKIEQIEIARYKELNKAKKILQQKRKALQTAAKKDNIPADLQKLQTEINELNGKIKIFDEETKGILAHCCDITSEEIVMGHIYLDNQVKRIEKENKKYQESFGLKDTSMWARLGNRGLFKKFDKTPSWLIGKYLQLCKGGYKKSELVKMIKDIIDGKYRKYKHQKPNKVKHSETTKKIKYGIPNPKKKPMSRDKNVLLEEALIGAACEIVRFTKKQKLETNRKNKRDIEVHIPVSPVKEILKYYLGELPIDRQRSCFNRILKHLGMVFKELEVDYSKTFIKQTEFCEKITVAVLEIVVEKAISDKHLRIPVQEIIDLAKTYLKPLSLESPQLWFKKIMPAIEDRIEIFCMIQGGGSSKRTEYLEELKEKIYRLLGVQKIEDVEESVEKTEEEDSGITYAETVRFRKENVDSFKTVRAASKTKISFDIVKKILKVFSRGKNKK